MINPEGRAGATRSASCCAPAPAAASADDIELSRLAKALAHPVRVQILRLLGDGSCVCGDLVDLLPLAQSTVSQHLKVLKEAGVVVGEVDGPRRCYCVDRKRLARFAQLLAGLQL